MIFWLLSGLGLILAGLAVGMLVFSAGIDASSRFEERTAAMTCFHCGRETDSSRHRCRHCGRELQ
jgi:predicted amidophosphoribosyltransferase